MKTLAVLVCFLGIISVGATKTSPKDEETCNLACNKKYTQDYRACNGIKECQTYVIHQIKSCILKCEGQTGE